MTDSGLFESMLVLQAMAQIGLAAAFILTYFALKSREQNARILQTQQALLSSDIAALADRIDDGSATDADRRKLVRQLDIIAAGVRSGVFDEEYIRSLHKATFMAATSNPVVANNEDAFTNLKWLAAKWDRPSWRHSLPRKEARLF